MMPDESSMRRSQEFWTAGMRDSASQSAAPANSKIQFGLRWSNTRAPVQVTAKAVNRIALARSIEIRSETEPYLPNSMMEAARNRSAKPHHATA